jgi:hypothetical protein
VARNVNVTWDLPTTRADGSALPVEEILHTRVEIAIAIADPVFSFSGEVLSGAVQEFPIADVDTGDWIVRLTVVDTGNREATPVDTPFNIPVSNPGGVTNVLVLLESNGFVALEG